MTHPLEAFQRIYIINLASRVDRRAEMAEQLARIGLGFQSSNVQLFEAVRAADAGGFPTIGARGCFMSHLGVLRDAVAAGLERILILEDDLNFSPDFTTRASGILARATAPECSIFYGGHQINGAPTLASGCVEIASAQGVRTTHFIGIQGPAIAAAASYLAAMLTRDPGDPEGGPMHVDGAYCWFRQAHPQWRTFAAVPELGYQRSSRTDIHDLRWFDKMPGVRRMVSALRSARNG